MSAADPINFGLQIEVDAIASTAIGGTNMAGGKANLAGTVAGVFIMQLITVMVNMNNVPYSYSLVIKTLVVIIAVCAQNGKVYEIGEIQEEDGGEYMGDSKNI